jgi:hypothetical protein
MNTLLGEHKAIMSLLEGGWLTKFPC